VAVVVEVVVVAVVVVVEGRRQRGRPKLRWEDGVMDVASKFGGKLEECWME
jgi:hypothetical protein